MTNTTTTQNQTIEIREATSGVERAQAAAVWLRSGGRRGSEDPSAPVLVAYVDGTPRAVARVRTNRFGARELRSFFATLGVDPTEIRAAFVDYVQQGEQGTAPQDPPLRFAVLGGVTLSDLQALLTQTWSAPERAAFLRAPTQPLPVAA